MNVIVTLKQNSSVQLDELLKTEDTKSKVH